MRGALGVLLRGSDELLLAWADRVAAASFDDAVSRAHAGTRGGCKGGAWPPHAAMALRGCPRMTQNLTTTLSVRYFTAMVVCIPVRNQCPTVGPTFASFTPHPFPLSPMPPSSITDGHPLLPQRAPFVVVSGHASRVHCARFVDVFPRFGCIVLTR